MRRGRIIAMLKTAADVNTGARDIHLFRYLLFSMSSLFI
jgi:hypothetical protein